MAKEAGVIYLLDGQLAGDYGNNANMFPGGPYVQPGHAGPITVDGITYPAGSAPERLTAGGGYRCPITWQELWRNCLQWTEDYSNATYEGNYESLTATQQAQVLADLWNGKPTNFAGIFDPTVVLEAARHDLFLCALVWASSSSSSLPLARPRGSPVPEGRARIALAHPRTAHHASSRGQETT